jgi:hypothetical protein
MHRTRWQKGFPTAIRRTTVEVGLREGTPYYDQMQPEYKGIDGTASGRAAVKVHLPRSISRALAKSASAFDVSPFF